jgi:dihydroorotase
VDTVIIVMSSLLIKGATVVNAGESFVADVYCEGRRIVSVVRLETSGSIGFQSETGANPVDRVIDGEGLHVLPGVIDAHVHFRDPGFPSKEDFASGCAAAAKGGVTTVFDMPNTNPPVFTVEDLELKRKIAQQKCLVNFGLWMGFNGENLDEIKAAEDIVGVKTYCNVTTGNHNLSDLSVVTQLDGVVPVLAFHAEGETFAEILDMDWSGKSTIYLCHGSLAAEVEMVREAKAKGMKVVMEVCPHHLFLTEEDRERLGGYGYMKPPLATQADQDALWEGIADGTVDLISTDHAPHTMEEKEGDDVPFGVPGVENSLALMLNAAHASQTSSSSGPSVSLPFNPLMGEMMSRLRSLYSDFLSLEKIVELMSARPAEVFGMRSRGGVEEGMDADLVVVDMERVRLIRNEDQVSKCGWTPYGGMKLFGVPVVTVVGGEIAYDDGKFFENVKGKEVRFS